MSDKILEARLKYTSASESRRVMKEAYGENALERGFYVENGKIIQIDVPTLGEIRRLKEAYIRSLDDKN